jgi:hypothetical protein
MKLIKYVRAATCKWLMVVLPVGVCAQGIHITPGANMVINGPVKLVLKNAGLITNGNFAPGLSTIIFSGDSNTVQSWLGGSAAASFYQIIINRPTDVMLAGNINIGDTLTMIKGNLQLNNFTIDLGGSIKGESNLSSVTGTGGGAVRTTAKLNAPHQVNPGNIGIELTSTANLGATVITRRHVQQSLSKGIQSIQRYFQISPTTNASLNATIRFFYLDKELAGANESALTLWKGADLGNYWLVDTKDSIDTKANYIVKTGIDHFTRYTLGPETTTVKELPVARKYTTQQVSPADSFRNNVPFTSLKPAAAQVYPNPLHDQFAVVLFTDIENDYVINLYDQFGHLLQRKKAVCRKGMNRLEWNMSNYAKGVYYLVFENRDLQNIKLIKQ